MYSAFSVATAAASEPVTAADVAQFCRIDIADADQPTLNTAIAAARAAAEQELRRFLVSQTVDFYFDRFPDGSYVDPATGSGAYGLQLPPLQSVTSITYVDSDGATQTLAAAQYLVDAKSRPARIEPAYGCSWPSTREQANAVTVRAVVGYGAAADVPASVRHWIALRAKTLWDNRDGLVLGMSGVVQMPQSFVDGLLDPERVHGYP